MPVNALTMTLTAEVDSPLLMSGVRIHELRLYLLAVFCAVTLSGCTQLQLLGGFLGQLAIPTYTAARSPILVESVFREQHPELSDTIRDNFPDIYWDIMVQAGRGMLDPSREISDVLWARTAIVSKFGYHAKYASDATQRVALHTVIEPLKYSLKLPSSQCENGSIPDRLLTAQMAALDNAIAEGLRAPTDRAPASGVGLTLLRTYILQRGVKGDMADRLLAGETVDPCSAQMHDVLVVMEDINSLEIHDTKVMRAVMVAHFASIF